MLRLLYQVHVLPRTHILIQTLIVNQLVLDLQYVDLFMLGHQYVHNVNVFD